MADVVLTCAACGRQTTVSEYVGAEGLVCDSCGAKLEAPVITRKTPRLGGRPAPAAPPATPTVTTGESALKTMAISRFKQRTRRQKVRDRRRDKSTAVVMAQTWGLFAVLAAAFWFVRHKNVLGGILSVDDTVTVALVVLGMLHLSMIAMAFRDEFFQGILCLLIPFYTLYYLLAVSDAFYLRALVGALLVGFGVDAYEFLRDHSYEIYMFVTNWLANASISS
jgi:hypothetical protein